MMRAPVREIRIIALPCYVFMHHMNGSRLIVIGTRMHAFGEQVKKPKQTERRRGAALFD